MLSTGQQLAAFMALAVLALIFGLGDRERYSQKETETSDTSINWGPLIVNCPAGTVRKEFVQPDGGKVSACMKGNAYDGPFKERKLVEGHHMYTFGVYQNGVRVLEIQMDQDQGTFQMIKPRP